MFRTATTLLAIVLFVQCGVVFAKDGKQLPNIIVIFTDDQGYQEGVVSLRRIFAGEMAR